MGKPTLRKKTMNKKNKWTNINTMKKILLLITLFCHSALAQMPPELIGSWVASLNATIQKMQSSSKWENNEIKYFRKILLNYKRIISQNKIEIINGKMTTIALLSLAQAQGKNTVVDVAGNNQKFQIEFIFHSKNNFIMKLSNT